MDDIFDSIFTLSQKEAVNLLGLLIENVPSVRPLVAAQLRSIGKKGEDYDELDELLDTIEENLTTLSMEPYIDDQLEIDDLFGAFNLMDNYLETAKAKPEQKKRLKELYDEWYEILCACGFENLAEACLKQM